MTIKFKILESYSKLKSNILKELEKLSSKIFRTKANRVSDYLKAKIYEEIYNCPEMESLRSDVLRADFGLNFDPTNSIAEAVASSVNIQILENGYNIDIQPITYFNLLSLPDSIIITENGDKLPWLDWLISYGDSVIIYNYEVMYKDGLGRSNMGVMVKSPGFFKVNPQYSGTSIDNFITRAISSPFFVSSVEYDISRILSR